MSTFQSFNTKLRLWVLLSISFATLGIAALLAGSSIYNIQNSTQQQKSQIVNVQLLAHLLAQAETESSPRSIREALEMFRVSQDNTEAIAYFKVIGAQTTATSVSGPFKESQIDGALVDRAVSSAVVQSDPSLNQRFTVAAPLSGINGKVYGVLLVRYYSAGLGVLPARHDILFILSAVMIGMSGLFGYFIVNHSYPREVFRDLKYNKELRLTPMLSRVLEIMFVAIVGCVLVYSGFNQAGQRESEKSLALSNDYTDSLAAFRMRLQAALVNPAGAQADLSLEAKSLSLPWPKSGYGSPEDLYYLLERVDDRLRKLSASRRSLTEDLSNRSGKSQIALLLTSILCGGALVALRMVANRESEFRQAQQVGLKHLSAYQQVSTNLPIGFFTFSGEDFIEWNEAWEKQKHRRENETAYEAFMRSLHPDDVQSTFDSLALACFEQEPFSFTYRLLRSDGKVRYFESRGVPVHDEAGYFDHLLGFTIDITERMLAQQRIEEKSHEVQAANARLQMALLDIEANFSAMVDSLVKVVEAKDPYTAGHSNRVMAYSVRIGEAMGLGPVDLRTLQMGAAIHDIGKIGIPDAVLTKPSRLTNEEFDLIKSHPVIGAKMVQDIPSLRACIPIIKHHHERMDGSGYPDGLVGNEIPMLVQICAVADCFDAMTSTRAYREGMPSDKALVEIRKSSLAGQLNPEIVSVLAEIIKRDGVLWRNTLEDAA